MTAAVKRRGWLALVALAMAIASILATLYARGRGIDPASYFERVALLRQLKQIDARRELDVLKARTGLAADYDALADPLGELDRLLGELDPSAPDVQALRDAVAQKTALIERFKSHNAVLRNSLAFLPSAAADADLSFHASAASDTTQASRPLSDLVDDVLLDTMIFSHEASDERAADIQLDLHRLESLASQVPPAAAQRIHLFASHVATVLREQQQVNRLLTSIAAVPTPVRIDAIDNRLASEQRAGTLRGHQLRQSLLVFAALLAGLLLYAAFSLVRSRAVIQGVNRELVAANATLEERVRQRTRELEAAQSELVATARHAGMAEIANNVLHNVGNVLNSVNVSAGIVAARVRESRVQGLAAASRLLGEHSGDAGVFFSQDERGRMLPAYLQSLAEALEGERREIAGEIDVLTRSVDHIKDIVAAQQAYAGASSVLEAVRIDEVVDDAMRMNAAAMARHQVSVVREGPDAPPLLLDKSRLMQILVNLIRNAQQAMAHVPEAARRIVLRTELDAGLLRLHVSDCGEGIIPENLKRIFSRGFTTRRNGHGFGLHSCAIAAREMGGNLAVASGGRGLGATFTLEVPARVPEGAR